jgi:uncharacterized repeat protein (TIGR03803 family)
MIRNECSPPVARPLLLTMLVLALVSSASAEWKEKVLYSFQGIPDGSVPVGAVVFDKAGNLYGATTEGGSSSCISVAQCGTVYQLVPPAKQGDPWTETVLYVFKGNASNDGASPGGGLVMDSAGNLYGTTAYGGTGNCVVLGTLMGCGTVFEMSPPKQNGGEWTETVLYSFPTPKQGFLPAGDLVFDGAGNLYGATTFGGGYGTTCNPFYQYCGAVFELSPPKTKGGRWTEKTLHGFKGGTDGANPNGGLVLDSKGDVYGTTYIGGYNCPHNSGQGCGTVFELVPPTEKAGAWAETVIHRFKLDSSDGGNPMAGLRLDGVGRVYGTTLNGGPGQYGTVFSLRPPSKGSGSWDETVLHGFNDDQQGAGPAASPIFDARGDLYGTTAIATNRSAQGNVFRMRPHRRKGEAWDLSIVYTFTGDPDGASPSAKLVFGAGGNIFSTTQEGGTGQSCQGGCGTVFEITH